MSSSVLACQDVSKQFGMGRTAVKVLQQVDFSVAAGESVAIMGQSGSGKSTLLHILGGLDQPTAGAVFWGDKDINKIARSAIDAVRNRHMGFIYQFHHLLAEFTALENVCMPLLLRNISTKKAKQQATELLEQVGLQDRVSHKPAELSGGERQRVAIARALVTEPKCVLADEPTGNLDSGSATQVFDLLLALNKEKQSSLILVTHDQSLASRTQKTFYLKEGVLSVLQTEEV